MSQRLSKNLKTTTATAQRLDASYLANFCKAAADPLRVEILRALRHDSFGVTELASIFSMPQPGMSHHLKIMATAGLLATKRQGNSIFYRRSLVKHATQFSELQASLYASVDEIPLTKDLVKNIENIYAERAKASRNFFDKHAGKFAEREGQLCELEEYLPNVRDLLDLTGLPETSTALEVGPGQGLLLEELVGRYQKLVALDNSGEMLSLAQAKLEQDSGQIEFINTALEDYQSKDGPFDVVVLNMVLHHMSSPVNALAKIKELVKSNGYLLIADLCSHDQAWVKESVGDMWLGFDPDELEEWAIELGFTAKQSLYLGLKNGFQIQLRLFQYI